MDTTEYRGWVDNVAKNLIAEREAAEARYIAEHKRAVFLFELLQQIETAVGDPQHPRHRGETYHDLEQRLSHPLGRFINAAAGDKVWYEEDFDFDAWERDYFGPIRALGEAH